MHDNNGHFDVVFIIIIIPVRKKFGFIYFIDDAVFCNVGKTVLNEIKIQIIIKQFRLCYIPYFCCVCYHKVVFFVLCTIFLLCLLTLSATDIYD